MNDTLPPLPEPAGFRTRYRSEPGMIGHYPWTYADQGRRRVDRPQHESESLYTERQVRELLAAQATDPAEPLYDGLTLDQVKERLAVLGADDLRGLVVSLLIQQRIAERAVAATQPA